MSRFTQAAAASQKLSILAMEEASRFGQRTADIEHLLLALVLDESRAGQVLRGTGITLDAARTAVADLHTSQLASLGITAEPPQPDRIVFHETTGYEWSERAMTLLSRAGDGGEQGYPGTLLGLLLAEPSGLIADLLGHLGTTPDAVGAALDSGDAPDTSPDDDAPDSLTGSQTSFAPAPVDEVWALLIDPARMRDWGPCFETVDYGGGHTDALPGDSWIGHAPGHGPDGRPTCLSPSLRRQRVELLQRRERSLIAWRHTYPDNPSSNSRRVEIALRPATGGTELRITQAWERRPGRARSRILGTLLRPVHRYAIWTQLSHLGGSIGRVFR